MDGWTDGRMDGWTDGRMDGWMDGCMDGWMDGWMDAFPLKGGLTQTQHAQEDCTF